MNFSQRIGLEPATRPLQIDGMTPELRNSLWNAFEVTVLPGLRLGDYSRVGVNAGLLVPLWMNFSRWPLYTLAKYAKDAVEQVRDWFFYQETPWNKAYEYVEFVGNIRHEELRARCGWFRETCNSSLERECSAYRFIGTTLSPITSEAEIRAIEEAAATDDSLLRPVGTHIDAALKLFSDKQNPDYRNSMKESISAVEAVCKIITGKDKATLGPALDAVKGATDLHPKLHEAFKALYGYTSDTHGIRHALKDDAEPKAEDAKFMLVACSGFVNYLAEKARKKGLLA